MHKTLTAFVLALSLGTSANPAFLDSLWSRFSMFWSDTKAGCGWDPSGQCLPANKAGAGWDPNGLSAPAPPEYSEEGCGWDPSGRCLPGS